MYLIELYVWPSDFVNVYTGVLDVKLDPAV